MVGLQLQPQPQRASSRRRAAMGGVRGAASRESVPTTDAARAYPASVAGFLESNRPADVEGFGSRI